MGRSDVRRSLAITASSDVPSETYQETAMRNATKACRALLPLAIVACSSATPTLPGFPGASSGDGQSVSTGQSSGDNGAVAASGSDTAPVATSGSAGDTPVAAPTATATASAAVDDAGPAPDASGLPGDVVSIQTVDIPVAANSELVKCQNFKNPFGKDVAILESDSTMVSSHHMFVFHDPSFDMDTNSVADCSGIEFHDLLHMAQTPMQSLVYPPGVGRVLAGTDGLRVLVHLLNAGTTAVTAHVKVAFRTVDPSAVATHAVSLFLNNALLSVPEGVSTQSRTFTVPANIEIMTAVSHMHSRATAFSATTNTGQVIYKGQNWNEPVPVNYTPAMNVAQGSVITWACTYNNMTGKTLTFGESANTNEMCILAGVAYPQTPGVELTTKLESVL
jgi:hypothetical protein